MSTTVREGSAVAHVASANRKLSPVRLLDVPASPRRRPVPVPPFVSSTYVSIKHTCPDTCVLKGAGCYVQSGYTKLANGLLDERGARTARRDKLAPMREEARCIDKLGVRGVRQDGGKRGSSGRDLRLHVGGDATCAEGAAILARAARRYRERGGGDVWTYTHRWRRIARRAWGGIHVLASVETVEEAKAALGRLYAIAMTVPQLPQERAVDVPGVGKLVPCPYETRGVTCVKCRLCLEPGRVGPGLPVVGVMFGAHGRDAADFVQLRLGR